MVTDMNILLCDDKIEELCELENMLENSGFDVRHKSFYNAQDLLTYVRQGADVDMCILDIVMPDMTGISLAVELRRGGYEGQIVFLSALNDFAAESYGVHAFSYLLKPPTKDAIIRLLKDVAAATEKRDEEAIVVRQPREMRRLLHREIEYVEVVDHYVYFHLTSGEYVEVYSTFVEITNKLISAPHFVKCHRSFIINMHEIKVITSRSVTMRSGKVLPVSRNYSDVKKEFAKWSVSEGILNRGGERIAP